MYIGITGADPEKRWLCGHGYPNNPYFSSAIKKYGWGSFSHEILFSGLSKDEAGQLEREQIALHQSTNREHGYNIELGGYGGTEVSEETREKLRMSHLGARNHNYGKQKSEEVRRKTSESNKRHWAEHPRPKGYKRPPEVLLKMSKSRTGCSTAWKGGHHSDETCRKIAESNSKKPVRCIETGVVYKTAKSASEETGALRSTISNVCNGKRKTAGGFHWEFA